MVMRFAVLILVAVMAWGADPVLTVNAGLTAYQINEAAVLIDGSAVVSDSDNPSSFDGGSLTVTILSIKDDLDAPLAPDPGDTLLVVPGQTIPPNAINPVRISVSGSIVYATTIINDVPGTPVSIAILAGGSGGTDLVLSLTRDCTVAAATALVRCVGFRNLRGGSAVAGRRTLGLLFSDGTAAGVASGSTKIQVVAAPQSPTASAVSVTTLEDASISAVMVGADPQGGALTYVLASQPEYGSASLLNSSTGAFRYVPPANWNGSSTFSYVVNNGMATSSPAIVSVTVTAVNDAPSFRAGGDLSAQGDGLPRTVPGWATSISPGGGTYESEQTVAFVVSTTTPSLFSVAPAISTTGTLTYTPAPGASGTAAFTVYARDSGGTANGGVDQSAATSARIVLAGVTLPPVVSSVTMATVVGATVTATPNVSASSTVTWALSTACSLGTLSINSVTGQLTLIPMSPGNETITASATSAGGTTLFSIPIIVQSNDTQGRPTIISAPSTEWVVAGQPWTYDLVASAPSGSVLDLRVSGPAVVTVVKASGNGFTISTPTALTDTLLDLTIVVWDIQSGLADAQRIFVRVVSSLGGNG